ncbi:hypothetical protein M513_06293, partial [Trichuris suis]
LSSSVRHRKDLLHKNYPRCFRCADPNRVANFQGCVAKNSKCRKCGKVGHFARRWPLACKRYQKASPKQYIHCIKSPLLNVERYSLQLEYSVGRCWFQPSSSWILDLRFLYYLNPFSYYILLPYILNLEYTAQNVLQ